MLSIFFVACNVFDEGYERCLVFFFSKMFTRIYVFLFLRIYSFIGLKFLFENNMYFKWFWRNDLSILELTRMNIKFNSDFYLI
jgi:hypothetical protein